MSEVVLNASWFNQNAELISKTEYELNNEYLDN